MTDRTLGKGGEPRQQTTDRARTMTTAQGGPISDDQNTLSRFGQGRSQVDCRRCLANAPFLIGDCDNLGAARASGIRHGRLL